MRWFQEKLYEHHAQMLSVDRVLHEGRTKFQEVLIFENAVFGTVMALDGVVQLTERDNHIYHEMIAHVPLMAHGSAGRVLIVGGGDGGTLKEVLKHPVAEVYLVELDGEVIDLAKQHLPDVSAGAFDDPQVTVTVADGVSFMRETKLSFDVIIVDSTDPMGPGAPLFSARFYDCCRLRLRPGGIIAVQSGAPFFQPQELDQVCGRLSQFFAGVRPISRRCRPMRVACSPSLPRASCATRSVLHARSCARAWACCAAAHATTRPRSIGRHSLCLLHSR